MGNLESGLFYRRALPHVQPPGATFFLTLRLAGSLPQMVLARLRDEAARLTERKGSTDAGALMAAHNDQAWRRLFGEWDKELGRAEGPRWLANPVIAALIVDCLRYWDARHYDLLAYCVMPNHVHWVLPPLPFGEEHYHRLPQITHTFKGYTAHQANRLLSRSGAFWQHESYDHMVRCPGELERIVGYVLANPVKAGLVADGGSWPWSYNKYGV